MMSNIYKEIRKLNPRNKNVSAVIVKGSLAGSRALFVNGKLHTVEGIQGEAAVDRREADRAQESAVGDPGNFKASEIWFKAHTPDLAGLSGPGLIELEGETVYYELLGGKKKLVVCGAGHVGLAVVRMGKLLGYHVTVIDDRTEFSLKAGEAGADKVITDVYEEGLAQVPGDQDTCFIIVTKAHNEDLLTLKAILKKEYAYIGLMASRKKVTLLTENLREEGYSEAAIRQVHMPIGLKIGAETPEEIAVCIMGEIIQTCSSGDKRFGYPEEMLDILCGDKDIYNGDIDALSGDNESEQIRTQVVLATVIRKVGSGPRNAGARMLVLGDGKFLGTVGGGKVEARTLKAAREMLEEAFGGKNPAGSRQSEKLLSAGAVRLISVELDAGSVDSPEMICGGRMDVLLEKIQISLCKL